MDQVLQLRTNFYTLDATEVEKTINYQMHSTWPMASKLSKYDI